MSSSSSLPPPLSVIDRLDTTRFPRPAVQSRQLESDPRIRENVFVTEPTSGLPLVSTQYENLLRAASLEDGELPFVGELRNGSYHFEPYRFVVAEARHIGAALLQLGVAPGESSRVGIAGINSIRYTVAMYALQTYAITMVPLYHNSKHEALCEIIERCRLPVVFCDSEDRAAAFIASKKAGRLGPLKHIILMDWQRERPPNTNIDGVSDLKLYDWEFVRETGVFAPREPVPPTPDSLYIICHTSGTTGTPKGVMMTHRNLLTAAGGLYRQWCAAPHAMRFGASDCYFSFLSLAHIYEHLMQVFMIYHAASIGIYSGDVSRLLADIQALRPTMISLVPRLLNKFHAHIMGTVAKSNFFKRTIFRIALSIRTRALERGDQRHDTIWHRIVFAPIRQQFGGRLRLLTTGGAPLTGPVMAFSRIAYGCPLFEGYGQTECGAAGTLNIPGCASNHLGGPAPWAQIQLVDCPDLGYFARENRGEICFRGAAVMRGYFEEPELTKKAIDEEGWLHTGDIGEWLPNGSLRVIDRKNALFKLAQGDFVSPEHIETVYSQSALVNQIFVDGRTERSFLVAVVVVNLEQLESALEKSGRSRLRDLLYDEPDHLVQEPAVRRFVLENLRSLGVEKGLNSIEQIRDVRLTTKELTAENGLLTPTLKIRRHMLRARFAADLDAMYNAEEQL